MELKPRADCVFAGSKFKGRLWVQHFCNGKHVIFRIQFDFSITQPARLKQTHFSYLNVQKSDRSPLVQLRPPGGTSEALRWIKRRESGQSSHMISNRRSCRTSLPDKTRSTVSIVSCVCVVHGSLERGRYRLSSEVTIRWIVFSPPCSEDRRISVNLLRSSIF